MTFVLAMTLFPETQRRAQEEIDNVVDDDRLPVLSDRPRLPYCDALVKEVMRFVIIHSPLHLTQFVFSRWNPALPIGVAHAAKNEDTYAGYHIPAKTVVIANQWCANFILADNADSC